MASKSNKTAAFLAAMQQSGEPETSAFIRSETPPVPQTLPAAAAKPKRTAAPSRAMLKHFGGYLDDDTLEKIALLRIRLKLDNSRLIKQAIEDLYRKHNAKRAFGDT